MNEIASLVGVSTHTDPQTSAKSGFPLFESPQYGLESIGANVYRNRVGPRGANRLAAGRGSPP